MVVDVSLWFLFPAGVLISTVAMMSGIGGAILFSPFFMLVLKLDPVTAVAAGLFIELFGFASGAVGYIKKKLVNFSVVKQLTLGSVIGTVIGVFAAQFIEVLAIKSIIVVLLLYISIKFLFDTESQTLHKHPKTVRRTIDIAIHKVDRLGKVSSYFGGFLLGLVSSGMGELNEYTFLQRLRMKAPFASGTSVILITICAGVGVAAHLIFILVEGHYHVFSDVTSIILFTVPGVVIGAQTGIYVVQHVSDKFMRIFVGTLFLLMALLMMTTYFF